jgi:hypothetical protein
MQRGSFLARIRAQHKVLKASAGECAPLQVMLAGEAFQRCAAGAKKKQQGYERAG